MRNTTRDKLQGYLVSKYKKSSDFVILEKNIYSKTSLSFKTIYSINEICPIVAIYYLSTNSKPYGMGYRIGVLLVEDA